MTAISSTSTNESSWPSFEAIKDNLSKPEKWQYLIPTIAAVAIGSFFVPNFAIGIAAGIGLASAGAVVAIALQALGVIELEKTESEYVKILKEWPLACSVLIPTIEEIIFRGGLQPLVARSIAWILPAAAAAFLGTPLSIATTVAIIATGAIFGLIHALNKHQNSHIQAAVTTFSGIAFGLLAAQFGLGAAIAAHIVNNTFLITLDRLVDKQQPPTPQTSTSAV